MSFEKEFEHSNKLYKSALLEFTAYGYEQASINSILNNAGMSKGQFYYHFKNKEGLYLALIDVMVEKKTQFLASMMKSGDHSQDIFGVFQSQIRYGMAFANKFPEINRFSESFLREKGTPIYQKVLQIHKFEDNQIINQLIEQAYSKGEFRKEFPLPFIKGIIGYLFTNIPEMLALRNVLDFEESLTHLIEFLKNGLASGTQEDIKTPNRSNNE